MRRASQTFSCSNRSALFHLQPTSGFTQLLAESQGRHLSTVTAPSPPWIRSRANTRKRLIPLSPLSNVNSKRHFSVAHSTQEVDALYYEKRFVKRKTPRVLQTEELTKNLTVLEENPGDIPPVMLQPILDSALAIENYELCRRCLKLLPRVRGGDMLNYTCLVVWLGKAGYIDEVFYLLDKMVEEGFTPTVFTFSKLVSSFAERGKIDRAIELHSAAKKYGLEFDAVAFNGLIVGFGKAGRLEKCFEVFDLMARDNVEPNEATFFELIMAAIRSKKVDRAFDIYEGMVKHFTHLKPNAYIYTALINASAGKNNIGLVEKYFKEMIDRGVEGDVFIYSSMLNAYTRAADPIKAFEMLETMKQKGIKPNIVTYGILAKLCRVVNDEERMVNLLKDIEASNLRLNANVYGNVILLYINVKKPDKALATLQKMIEDGLYPDSSMFDHLERACASDLSLLTKVRQCRQVNK